MTQPLPLPVADATATPAFRRVLAAIGALAAFWLIDRLFAAGPVTDTVAAGVALAVGVLAWRHATFLLALFVALMPVGLFVAAILGL